MKKIDIIKEKMQHYVNSLVGNDIRSAEVLNQAEVGALERKVDSHKNRKTEVVKSNVKANVIGEKFDGQHHYIDYLVHFQNLVKQQRDFYMEEEVDHRLAVFSGDQLIRDEKVEMTENREERTNNDALDKNNELSRDRYTYDRRAAVQYAEQWWNSYNQAYKKFDVDCTNYVSQCVHAGGAPMRGYPNRNKGWWYRNENWSYSWSVAHAFRWYLSGSDSGLQAREVESAQELSPGDIICYDFEGDGHFDHNTIVVAKDENNEPLVNAHTSNSRMRYWKYEDSTAWTPDIRYKFFHIVDG